MKIKLKKITFCNEETYKIISIDKCCDTILHNPVIHSGHFYDELSLDCGFMVALNHNYEWDSYGDSIDEDYYYQIKYCPFCGEPIDIEIVEEVDVTEEYRNLADKCDILRKAIIYEDSISKRKKMKDELHELDCEVDSYYQSDDIHIEESENEA